MRAAFFKRRKKKSIPHKCEKFFIMSLILNGDSLSNLIVDIVWVVRQKKEGKKKKKKSLLAKKYKKKIYLKCNAIK